MVMLYDLSCLLQSEKETPNCDKGKRYENEPAQFLAVKQFGNNGRAFLGMPESNGCIEGWQAKRSIYRGGRFKAGIGLLR